jgi:CRP-like cAMP-binding protein
MAVEQPILRNRLLAALPADALALLLPHLREVDLPFRTTLTAASQPLPAAWFPQSGYVSLLVMLADGGVTEVGMVGREGMLGMPLVLGTDRFPIETLVQAAGTALRIEADAFNRALDDSPALRDLMLRYVMAFNVQVTLTAACNARHLVGQRLARWLLMAHDRADRDDFAMTHDFLSMMLGVRRAGVTVAAGALQRAGTIKYEQGRIWVTDRPGLEAAACECHGIVRQEFSRLLGQPASP